LASGCANGKYLKIEDITFYNLSVYHYNFHDKQNYIITGWGTQNWVEYVLKIIDGWAGTADAMPVARA